MSANSEKTKSKNASYESRTDTQPRETRETSKKWGNIAPPPNCPYPRAGQKSNLSQRSSLTKGSHRA